MHHPDTTTEKTQSKTNNVTIRIQPLQ